MLESITQYFNMQKTLNSATASELTKSVIRSTGLPELMATTSSPALRNRIQKDISNGVQSNQHTG
jgi:hypothetical protein